MLAVLLLFILPYGGGIPAGVLLASAKGLAWPTTAGLYCLSDVLLALAFEPVLRLIIALGSRSPALVRLSILLKLSMKQMAARFGATSTGPCTLILISFGLDPMTGRAMALAAGHGPVAGWTFAILGDLLYYAVIAISTLRLNAYIRNPYLTAWIVMGAMFAAPLLVGLYRTRRLAGNR